MPHANKDASRKFPSVVGIFPTILENHMALSGKFGVEHII